MTDVHILAIDLAKRSFQVCATAVGGAVLFNRTVSRAKLETILREEAPCIVAMEACATSHFWGRFARGLGHEVRLIPPIYVKPFVKRQKNDAADAAAIAEAALRPNLHYVAVKSAEHQARAVAFRTHQSFVGQRTQLINAMRGHLGEFGLVVAQGPTGLLTLFAISFAFTSTRSQCSRKRSMNCTSSCAPRLRSTTRCGGCARFPVLAR